APAVRARLGLVATVGEPGVVALAGASGACGVDLLLVAQGGFLDAGALPGGVAGVLAGELPFLPREHRVALEVAATGRVLAGDGPTGDAAHDRHDDGDERPGGDVGAARLLGGSGLCVGDCCHGD